MKAMILHGSGGCTKGHFWYASVAEGLRRAGIEVVLENMPDADLARRKYWIPFVTEKLLHEKRRILIGHSSGTVAALRFVEEHTADVVALVAAYHTDLGIEAERVSGYFDEPWDWDRIRENTGKILIFASTDDPFIPIEEPRFVRDRLCAEYIEFENKEHFCGSSFPELADAVIRAASDHA